MKSYEIFGRSASAKGKEIHSLSRRFRFIISSEKVYSMIARLDASAGMLVLLSKNKNRTTAD